MKTYAGFVRISLEHNAIDDEWIVKRFEQSINVSTQEQALQRVLEMVIASRKAFCEENDLIESEQAAPD